MMKQATRSYPIPKKGKALMVQQAARVRKKPAKGPEYVQGKTSITNKQLQKARLSDNLKDILQSVCSQ